MRYWRFVAFAICIVGIPIGVTATIYPNGFCQRIVDWAVYPMAAWGIFELGTIWKKRIAGWRNSESK
jgi:hypothetical protein